MNYTKMIRKYCEKRSGETIDIGTIAIESFNMVPYKTLSKCLGACKRNACSPKSKAVYIE